MLRRHGKQKRQQLDCIGRELVRAATTASAQNTDEVEAAAAAPFLYRRIKAAIAVEQQRRTPATHAASWLWLLVRSRHATPAVLAITFATITFLFTATFTRSILDNRAAVGATELRATTMEQIVFNEEGELLTSDEVLATLVGDEAAFVEDEQ